MKIIDLHHWVDEPSKAIEIQKSLASRIILEGKSNVRLTTIAGVDVSGVSSVGPVWAAAVVIKLPQFDIVERSFAVSTVNLPYVPGLLSFRELPVILEALKKLQTVPDLIICDGQGLAHPRFFGLACHLGLWVNLPTVGCAKSRLIGKAPDPGINAGDYELLEYKDRTVGLILRTRTRVKPVYVSPGHLIDVDGSRRVIMSCCNGRRLPEPTRLAHLAVNSYRKGKLK